MISFNCPKCTKGFITPDKSAGAPWHCTDCGEGFNVPASTPRKPKGRVRLYFVLLCLLLVVALASLWTFRGVRPTLIRNRLANGLAGLSSNWQGLEWLECDVEKKSYKISVYHRSERDTYHFEVICTGAGSQTIVRVNPPHWLAYAVFRHGLQESFLYQGKDRGEQRELEFLASDLDEVVRRAVR